MKNEISFIYCTNCGTKLESKSNFCNKCGSETTAIEKNSSAPNKTNISDEIDASLPQKNSEKKSIEEFCYQCKNYDSEVGFCYHIKANVRLYPKKFLSLCNGKYYLKNLEKVSAKLNETKITEPQSENESGVQKDGVLVKKILKWFLFILIGISLGALINSGVGPNDTYLTILGILLLIILAAFLLWGFKKRRESFWEKWHLSIVTKVGTVIIVFAVLMIFLKSASLRELPQKYSDGVAALDSSNWDIAVEKFSSVYSLNPNYEGVDSFLKESMLKKEESVAKELYAEAKKSLERATVESDRGEFRLAIESTKIAIGLLKKAERYSETSRVLDQAEKSLTIIQRKEEKNQQRLRKIREKEEKKQAELDRKKIEQARSLNYEDVVSRLEAWKKEDNSFMAYIMMEGYVKDRIKSPASAKFPGIFDGQKHHITYLGNQKYQIISYVDSQNSFGAMIRAKFIGEIKQISEDRWRLISLNIL